MQIVIDAGNHRMHECKLKIVYQDELLSDCHVLITRGLSENAFLRKQL